MEFEDIFDHVMEKMDGFPSIDYRFKTMRDYINEIEEFLEFTHAQKIQRLKAKIPTIEDPVEKGEMEGELAQPEEDGLEYLSHTIWGGVLVSIFATYESSIQEIFKFFETKKGKIKFKKEPRKSFIESVENHSKKNLNIGIFQSRADKLLLNDLSQLRNSYVHNGCEINSLPNRLQEVIIQRRYGEYSLGITDNKWVANASNAKLYFKYIYDSFESYSRRSCRVIFDQEN
ncbi:hypothetical protein [Saccharospirillum alexandrii]|uniref:hypothetical protein n=1 Tax=Saccharospirillum alexandrii TaxID=2448477 RepID=UPI003735F27A